jgi:hypothetical protein
MLYTTIVHELRQKYHLTIPEYCVLDAIKFLSANPKAPVPGWCNASKAAIGELLGVSKPFVVGTIQKLIDIHLVEKNGDGRNLRVTEVFYNDLLLVSPIGKASDRKRGKAGKASDPSGQIDDQNRSDGLPNRSDGLPPSERTEKNKEKQKEKQSADAPVVLPFGSQEFADAWTDWEQHRKDIRKKLTPKSVELQFKKLSQKPEAEAIAMIKQAIEKGWTGLYELKDRKIINDDLSPLIKGMMTTFENYFELKTTFTFLWNNFEDVKALTGLAQIFATRLNDKGTAPTDENVVNAFSNFLPRMPDHYQNRSLTPELIYKNFNKIINEITHALGINNNQQQQSSALQYV